MGTAVTLSIRHLKVFRQSLLEIIPDFNLFANLSLRSFLAVFCVCFLHQ